VYNGSTMACCRRTLKAMFLFDLSAWDAASGLWRYQMSRSIPSLGLAAFWGSKGSNQAIRHYFHCCWPLGRCRSFIHLNFAASGGFFFFLPLGEGPFLAGLFRATCNWALWVVGGSVTGCEGRPNGKLLFFFFFCLRSYIQPFSSFVIPSLWS
jgi:hypothetical protein